MCRTLFLGQPMAAEDSQVLGLPIPLPGGRPDDSELGTGTYMRQPGSYLTAHFDTANPFDDLVSLFEQVHQRRSLA
jgi:hypothetical protein